MRGIPMELIRLRHTPDGVLQGSPQVLLLDEANWRPRSAVIQSNAQRRMVCVPNRQGVHFL